VVFHAQFQVIIHRGVCQLRKLLLVELTHDRVMFFASLVEYVAKMVHCCLEVGGHASNASRTSISTWGVQVRHKEHVGVEEGVLRNVERCLKLFVALAVEEQNDEACQDDSQRDKDHIFVCLFHLVKHEDDHVRDDEEVNDV